MTHSRRKGRRYELDVIAHLDAAGLEPVDRNRSGFDGDDLWLPSLGVSVECKNRRAMALAEWADQARQQADGGRWVVVHKRVGVADVGAHYLTTTVDEWIAQMNAQYEHGYRQCVTDHNGDV